MTFGEALVLSLSLVVVGWCHWCLALIFSSCSVAMAGRPITVFYISLSKGDYMDEKAVHEWMAQWYSERGSSETVRISVFPKRASGVEFSGATGEVKRSLMK